MIPHLHIRSILYLVGLSLVCWFVLRQCNSGRISEAFAAVDPGIRSNFSIYDKLLEEELLDLTLYWKHYQTPKHQQNLEQLTNLVIQHKAFQTFLDSIRAELMAAAGLPVDQPIPLYIPQAHQDVIKNVLLSGQPNCLSQISVKAAHLKATMLQLGDSNVILLQTLPLLYHSDQYDANEILNFKGNVCDLPLSGSLALLSNLQQLSYASMFSLVYYLKEKEYSIIVCGGFSPFASMNTSYILEGDQYDADIFFSSYFKYDFIQLQTWINGKLIHNKDGIAHYEVKTTQPGKHILDVQYTGSFLGKTAAGHYYIDTLMASKKFVYYVGSARVQVWQPGANQFLYAFSENPVTVVSWDNYNIDSVHIVKGKAFLKKLGKNRFTIVPQSFKPVTLKAGKFGTFQFPVRPLPDPIASLALPSSTLSPTELAAQTSLLVHFPKDFDFEAPCTILNFRVTRFRKREDPQEIENQGNTFSEETSQLLQTAMPGDRFLFDEIRVQCGQEPAPRTIAGLSLRLE